MRTHGYSPPHTLNERRKQKINPINCVQRNVKDNNKLLLWIK